MAASYTLTRNLRLRVDRNLSANAKYNLARLDLIGSIVHVDTTNATVIQSRTSVTILPNSIGVGGSGLGGTVNLGTASQPLDVLNINANTTNFGASSDILTSSNTKTITNKTMDFNANTFLNFPSGGGGSGFSTIWALADGTGKTVVHGLGSQAVEVGIIDLFDNQVSYPDTITIIDNNTISLQSSEAPNASGWRVVVLST